MSESRAVSRKTLSPTDAAYIAGIIDGEGSIGWYASGARVRVRMSNIDAIRFLHEKAGGTVTHSHNETPVMAQWSVGTHSGLRWLLPQIVPYLTTKRREAELLYHGLCTVTGRGGVLRGARGWVGERLKELKGESRNVTPEAICALRGEVCVGQEEG